MERKPCPRHKAVSFAVKACHHPPWSSVWLAEAHHTEIVAACEVVITRQPFAVPSPNQDRSQDASGNAQDRSGRTFRANPAECPARRLGPPECESEALPLLR